MAAENGHAAPDPQPVAFQLLVQEVQHNGRAALQLVEVGQMSTHTIVLTPEHAQQIGEALQQHGRRLATGLVLPPSQN